MPRRRRARRICRERAQPIHVVNGAAFTHDARRNLTSDGSRSFTYDLENRLLGVSGSAAMNLEYDPPKQILGAPGAQFREWRLDELSLILLGRSQ